MNKWDPGGVVYATTPDEDVAFAKYALFRIENAKDEAEAKKFAENARKALCIRTDIREALAPRRRWWWPFTQASGTNRPQQPDAASSQT